MTISQLHTTTEIELNIKQQIRVILGNIDFVEKKVQVHRFSGNSGEDLSRSAFALTTLTRAKEFLSMENLMQTSSLVDTLLTKCRQKNTVDSIVGTCYLLRAQKNLGVDKSLGLAYLEQQDYQAIFKYPVSMYVFITMAQELQLAQNTFLYSVRNQCLASLEYLLATGQINSFPIFSLTEVNYWKEYFIKEQDVAGSQFHAAARAYLLDRFSNISEIELGLNSSSGLAKCLEFLSFEVDKSPELLKFEKQIFDLLEKRKINNTQQKFTTQLRDTFLNQNMYFENSNSGHISLDTNVHLLNYYLNLYYSHAKNS